MVCVYLNQVSLAKQTHTDNCCSLCIYSKITREDSSSLQTLVRTSESAAHTQQQTLQFGAEKTKFLCCQKSLYRRQASKEKKTLSKARKRKIEEREKEKEKRKVKTINQFLIDTRTQNVEQANEAREREREKEWKKHCFDKLIIVKKHHKTTRREKEAKKASQGLK